MVLTSHSRMGDTEHTTGFWLEEFAAPYYAFKDAGFHITLCSPAGGHPPIDPTSQLDDHQTSTTQRFDADEVAKTHLTNTLRLVEVQANDYDAVFYPGGHGPLWDLACDPDSVTLIDDFYSADKPIGAVCHATGALINAANEDESPMVQGKQLTGFSNAEEDAVGLSDVVPFSLEDELKKRGATYLKGPDWQEFVVVDGRLVTGQNPASSEATAKALIKLMTLE
uniref:type 1 glutamine amidotransferase domain-containing protein n=1 Tax=Vibrio sp. 10N TaxID=3058938 RepID=UPI0030C6BE67